MAASSERHFPLVKPDAAQPLKFHSPPSASSSVNSPVPLLRKSSTSAPSIRLKNARTDLPSGPSTSEIGFPPSRSAIGLCFRIVSNGYALASPASSSPITTSRDFNSVPGKLIGTGNFATSCSHLLSYFFASRGTALNTCPLGDSFFHSPKLSSSDGASSTVAPFKRPKIAFPVICCHHVPVSRSRIRKF